jgi:hypothetical protein
MFMYASSDPVIPVVASFSQHKTGCHAQSVPPVLSLLRIFLMKW